MHRRLAYTFFSSALAIALFWAQGLVGPATSHAATPSRYSEHDLNADCLGFTNEAGSVDLVVHTSNVTPPDGYLAFWASGSDPLFDAPALQAYDQNGSWTITRDGLTLSISIPLFDADFQPTGLEATVSDMTFAPDGDPIPIGSFRDGNVRFKQDGIIQPLVATGGTLSIPSEATFALAGCSGIAVDSNVFQTNPMTQVFPDLFGLTLACGDQTTQGSWDLFAVGSRNKVFFFGVGFFPVDGPFQSGEDSSAIQLSDKGVRGTVPLVDTVSGDPSGSATFDGVFYNRQSITYTTKTDSQKYKLIGDSYSARGTVTFSPGGQTFDLSQCQVLDRRSQTIIHS
jgi:hypothetical protein